jgi:DNA-binding IclR family transcriptional regulator
MSATRFTDGDLLGAVAADRYDFGACTLSSLANRLDVSRSAVQERVDNLIESRLLIRSELPGSLRLNPDALQPLH